METFCVCGHDVHAHEDDEGGTRECQLCECQQFYDRIDRESDINRFTERYDVIPLWADALVLMIGRKRFGHQ